MSTANFALNPQLRISVFPKSRSYIFRSMLVSPGEGSPFIYLDEEKWLK